MASRETVAKSETRKLRSLNYEVKTFVRFVNTTNRTLSLMWYDYKGQIVSYSIIKPHDSEEKDTYVTHPWMAKDNETGLSLLMNGEEIFYPREDKDGIPFEEHHRDIINIHIPVYTLLQRCAEVVYYEFGKETIQRSNIPAELKRLVTSITEPYYDTY